MACGGWPQTRTRKCKEPPFPEMRDRFCKGKDSQFRSCYEENCPSMKALVLIFNHAQVNNVLVLSAPYADFLSSLFTYSSRD